MKINLKDFRSNNPIDLIDNNLIYETPLDNLSKSWNKLSAIQATNSKGSDVRNYISNCKVETDTLETTFNLISKNIIKARTVREMEEEVVNINVIDPCIELFTKEIEYLENLKISETSKQLKWMRVIIEYKDFVYLKEVESDMEEYMCSNGEYSINIQNITDDKPVNIFCNAEAWHVKYLDKFIKCLSEHGNDYLKYLNLYISKMYILRYKNDSLINYGKILEDGYGEIVIIIREDDVYKITRDRTSFNIYKNEKQIL